MAEHGSQFPAPQPAGKSALGEVDELLPECCSRPEGEWRNTVEELCRRHPQWAETLRARFEALLCDDAAARVRGLSGVLRLELNGRGRRRVGFDNEPEGGRLAKYRLAERIGEGGVGVVFRGHDTELGREVALKFLHARHRDSPELLHRFLEEAQIGGQLQHPGIVPVHELGMAGDQLFFAMKLIDGHDLASLLAMRTEPGEERRRYIDIFEAICQTLAYAHARGVIHRDLKPANVMIGSFGEIQVVDWGMAKVLDQSPDVAAREKNVQALRIVPRSAPSPSLQGSVMGTPAYMAPEQARGLVHAIDARSDVFALGAILCEILTGAPPYLGETAHEVLERAARCDLEHADRRLGECSADPALVQICRDCLQERRSSRPASAQILAQRVSEHLASVAERAQQAHVEAAEARVKAASERRARRLTVGLAATIVLALVVGIVGWLWIDALKRDRRNEVIANLAVARRDAQVARDREDWSAARLVARAARAALPSDAAESLRADADTWVDAIVTWADDAETAADREQRTSALLRELVDVRQPESGNYYRRDWGEVANDYGTRFGDSGLDLFQGSVAEAAGVLTTRTDGQRLLPHVDTWSRALARAGEVARSERLTRVADLADGDPVRREIRHAILAGRVEALQVYPDSDRLEELPPPTLALIASALVGFGAHRSALAVYRRAQLRYQDDFVLTIGLARELLRQTPSRNHDAARFYQAALVLRPESIEVRHELGELLGGRLAEPGAAIELLRDSVRLRPGDGHLWYHIGIALANSGQPAEAEAAYRKAIELEPNDVGHHLNLSAALIERAAYAEAEQHCHEAIRLDPSKDRAYGNLGMIHLMQGRIEDAVAAYQAAIAIAPQFAKHHADLGRALMDKPGATDEAIEAFTKALEIGPPLVLAYANRGMLFGDKGEFDRAIADERAALSLDDTSAPAHYTLGTLWLEKGNPGEALAPLRRAMELDPQECAYPVGLGRALRKAQQRDEAVQVLERALDRDPHCPNYALVINELYNCGAELATTGRHADSIAVFENCERALGRVASPDPDLVVMVRKTLGESRMLVAREPELVALMDGTAHSTDPAELAQAADLATCRGRHADAVRLYRAALAFGEGSMTGRLLCNAARTAMLAAEGADVLAPIRAGLRCQARDWLASFVAASHNPDQEAVATLKQLQAASEFAAIRDAQRLTEIGEQERDACCALWHEIDRLLQESSR